MFGNREYGSAAVEPPWIFDEEEPMKREVLKAGLVDLVGALERAIREWEEYYGPCNEDCGPEYYCSMLKRMLELTQGELLE